MAVRRTVLEIKHTLDGERRTYATALLDEGEGFAVVRYVVPEPTRVGPLTLPRATTTVAYYWAGRPYNLYHWLAPSGATIALYFNLSRGTRIGAREIEWHDLAVDVLVTPDGTVRVLDEEELPPDLPASTRQAIEEARRAVEHDLPDLLALVEPASRRYLAAIGPGGSRESGSRPEP